MYRQAALSEITCPKCGFASTFTHGAGVHLPMRCRNDVLASVRRESAESVEEHQIVARQRRRLPVGSDRWVRVSVRSGTDYFYNTATVDLVRQYSPAVGDDGTSYGLEQDAVLVRYLVHRSYKNAAWLIGHVGFDACGNESHDPVLQKLPVTGAIFVPESQVHRQSF